MIFRQEKKYYEAVAKEVGVVASVATYFLFRKWTLSILLGPLIVGILTGPLDTFDDVTYTETDESIVYTHKAHTYVPDMGMLPKKHWALVFLFGYQFITEFFRQTDTKKNVRAFFTLTSFKVGPELEVPLESITQKIPKRCIILMHHRRHHHPGLTVAEFNDMVHMLSDDKFHIVAGRGWGRGKTLLSKALGYLETKIYNAIDVAGCARNNSDMCYEKLLEPFLAHDETMKLIIFPDKYGAQYFGDRAMFYREGAFATAMAAGVPIVDTLSMYPTYGTQRHIFKITNIIEPASWWPKPLAFGESFAEYRKKHHKEIEYLTKSMQQLFFNEIETLEAQIGTCSSQIYEHNNETCKIIT